MGLGLIGSVNNRGAQTYATGIGTLSQPASGSISISEFRSGPLVVTTLTLTAARISVTDAGASGSYGSLAMYALPAGAIAHLGCRTTFTAFAEGAALTGGAGDAAFEIAIGVTAIGAAANGTLSGNAAFYNITRSAIAVTLSGGTGTGSNYESAAVVFDGTNTAITLRLNWSGSAATIDANSTIDVTGSICFAWLNLGDD